MLNHWSNDDLCKKTNLPSKTVTSRNTLCWYTGEGVKHCCLVFRKVLTNLFDNNLYKVSESRNPFARTVELHKEDVLHMVC